MVAIPSAAARLGSCVALLLFAVPAAALAQPPEPVYQLTFGDCVTGNNQFYSGGKFHWWVNQTAGADGSAGPDKCDSHQNDQYERPTDQTFRNNTVTRKPSATPPFNYSSPAQPKSPVFLSGLLPDTEFAQGASAFSTDSGLYFEFVDITRGQAGFVGGQTLAGAVRDGLRLSLGCKARCRIRLTVRLARATARRLGVDRLRVARANLLLRQAGTRRLHARLPAALGQRLARLTAARFIIRVRTVTRGRASTVRRSVTLRAAEPANGWLFFRIELFGRAEVTSDLERNSRDCSAPSSNPSRGGNASGASHPARTTPSGLETTRSRVGQTGESRFATRPARTSLGTGRPPARRYSLTPTAASAAPEASTSPGRPTRLGTATTPTEATVPGSTCAKSTCPSRGRAER